MAFRQGTEDFVKEFSPILLLGGFLDGCKVGEQGRPLSPLKSRLFPLANDTQLVLTY